MNRLKGQRVYLAGPIDRCPDEGRSWRESISSFLTDLGVVILNPLNKPTEIAKEDSESRQRRKYLKVTQQYDELRKEMKVIRNVDLRMVDISDFLIVHLDLDIFACGTIEEVDLANRQKKPIIVHMKQGKENAPDWLFAMIPHQTIFSSWNVIENYLLAIDTGLETEDNLNRWYFFNLK